MKLSMNKEQRHQHILRTAKILFQERGYDNVTIADVIVASNIARGTFYLHFASLEDLLAALFQQVMNETWNRIAPILKNLDISFRSCTIAVIETVFRMFDDDPAMAAVFYSGGGHAFVQVKQQAMYGQLGQLLVEALEYRHNAHIPHLQWTAAMLISLVGDMSYYAIDHVPKDERSEFEKQLIAFVLAGLQKHLEPYVTLSETSQS